MLFFRNLKRMLQRSKTTSDIIKLPPLYSDPPTIVPHGTRSRVRAGVSRPGTLQFLKNGSLVGYDLNLNEQSKYLFILLQ